MRRNSSIGVGLLVLASGVALGHGAVSMEKDVCKLRVGAMQMHFAGYQPDYSRDEFCEDIPKRGRTVIVLDFVDDALRDLKVELSVLQRAGGQDDKVVYRIPAARYPNGSIAMDYEFKQPGDYVGMITVDDGRQKVMGEFPFAVAKNRWLQRMVVAAAALIAGACAMFFWASSHKRFRPIHATHGGTTHEAI